jgi:succinate-semialdehyde dehydrogenase/glutarate-semialdehyde dehydrogenase
MPEIDLPADQPTGLYVDGVWRPSSDGSTFPVLNPATEKELAVVASASPADGIHALEAAAAAQESWAATPARTRSELLRAAFERVIERTDDFAAVMTLEMGKPLADARGEVTYGAEFLRWFAEEAPRVAGRYQQAPEGTSRQLVTKRPVGPCLFVTPWNFPLAMGTRKIAPALAAGCTVVLKPAEWTPLTSLLLVKVLADVGVPPGVVNIVPTSASPPLVAAVMSDQRLRKLSFTGSTATGKALLAQAAENVLRTSMELGGNAPLIVYADADLDLAVEGAQVAKLRNMGEACTAANRMLVHADVADDFARRLAERFGALQVGDGTAEGTDIGPLITSDAREQVHALVTDAVAAGASVATGGEVPPGPGWFYPPTVLVDVPASATIVREEIFGPVAPIVTFRTDEEALALANDAEVGLAGYVFTSDMDRVLDLADRLEVGMIGVNQGLLSNVAAPFGGVKHSGLGREGGREGIEEFLETVYLALPKRT